MCLNVHCNLGLVVRNRVDSFDWNRGVHTEADILSQVVCSWVNSMDYIAPQLTGQCLGFNNVLYGNLTRVAPSIDNKSSKPVTSFFYNLRFIPVHWTHLNGSGGWKWWDLEYLSIVMSLWKISLHSWKSLWFLIRATCSSILLSSDIKLTMMREGRTGLYLFLSISLRCLEPAIFPQHFIAPLHSPSVLSLISAGMSVVLVTIPTGLSEWPLVK